MPYNPLFDLTNQLIKDSFSGIVQVGPSGEYYDGLGNEIFISGSTGPQGPTGPIGPTGAQGATGSVAFFFQNTVPTGTIQSGNFWLHSDTGVLYIYVDDGTSTQWVERRRSS